MLEIFVLNICFMQGLGAQSCTSSKQAYYSQINGQKYADVMNKKYLEPIPLYAKNSAEVVYFVYYRKLHLAVTKNIILETSQNSSTVNLRWEFK